MEPIQTDPLIFPSVKKKMPWQTVKQITLWRTMISIDPLMNKRPIEEEYNPRDDEYFSNL